MSEQELHSDKESGQKWFKDLFFLRIFQGFRMAVQPGKLILALAGVVVLFVGGWILDGLTPRSERVVSSLGFSPEQAGLTEIEAYVQGIPEGVRSDLASYREQVRSGNEGQLRSLVSALGMDNVAGTQDIRSGEALAKIEKEYEKGLKGAVDKLKERYEGRKEDIKTQYKNDLDSGAEKAQAALTRDRAKDKLRQAYDGLLKVMLRGESSGQSVTEWLNVVVVPKAQVADKEQQRQYLQRDQAEFLRVIQLAQAYRTAQLVEGAGIFKSIVDFKLARLHGAISALVWQRDLAAVAQQIRHMLLGVCWLTRFHPVFALLITLLGLSIWALVGGAICRMAALQQARDERIGPLRALQFSMSKFGSFFSAPLIPVGIVILISVFIFMGGIAGAIPVVGEWIAGLLTGLALFGGFVIALVLVGLAGGFNLMYPTIAVEGSDSFDAISRSFSYLFARPWRMGFYTFLAAVYGGICYLFVRLFIFLMLISVHSAAGLSMNWDGSSMADIRGKLEAIWPRPSLAELQPAINWVSLSWTESIGAFFIWVWVSLAVGLILAFLISYFYSVNTIIYTLLRKHVDDTDLEDIYLEQEVESLLSEEVKVEEAQPQEAAAQPEGQAQGGKEAAGESKDSQPQEQPGEDEQEKPGS